MWRASRFAIKRCPVASVNKSALYCSISATTPLLPATTSSARSREAQLVPACGCPVSQAREKPQTAMDCEGLSISVCS